jgi:hypothetical protein
VIESIPPWQRSMRYVIFQLIPGYHEELAGR